MFEASLAQAAGCLALEVRGRGRRAPRISCVVGEPKGANTCTAFEAPTPCQRHCQVPGVAVVMSCVRVSTSAVELPSLLPDAFVTTVTGEESSAPTSGAGSPAGVRSWY